jgi:hypothetical protein
MHGLFYSISFEANIFNRTIARLLKKARSEGHLVTVPCVAGELHKGSNEIWSLLERQQGDHQWFQAGVVAHAISHHEANKPETEIFSLDFVNHSGI